MGDSSQRRERRLAEELGEALAADPAQFDRIWGRYLGGWCCQIQARGRTLKRGPSPASGDEVLLGPKRVQRLPGVFPILEKVERLLAMIGVEANARVGRHTREVLTHECCKAFAEASDPRLYPLARGPGRGP